MQPRSCIRERLETLPEPYRAVLQMSETDGLSDAEIAAAVGTTVGNVKVRLHRARARLREDLRCHCALYRDERNELACEPRRGGGSRPVSFPGAHPSIGAPTRPARSGRDTGGERR